MQVVSKTFIDYVFPFLYRENAMNVDLRIGICHVL